MTKYQFSTVKLIPNLVRDESVNIGVILYDSEEKRAYPKFTTNWKEVSHRAGVDQLSDLPKILDKDIKTDDDYLDTLSSTKFQDSLIITKPKPISIIESLNETLDVLFDTQISLSAEDATECKQIQKFHSWLGNLITNMKFPEKTYKTSYTFNQTIVDKKFPYVFLKDKYPYLGLDYLSFIPTTILNNTKLKSFDINLIRNSQSTKKTIFQLFSTQEKDEIKLNDKRIKKSLELLKLVKIPIIYKNDLEYEFDKLCKILVTT
ncbi:MAG: DUF3037 domain-containing protein [Thaumarchaeota archaeon]|nr:DUF3037 domain-containing protein [Nitrososphaerota archaeon]